MSELPPSPQKNEHISAQIMFPISAFGVGKLKKGMGHEKLQRDLWFVFFFFLRLMVLILKISKSRVYTVITIKVEKQQKC